MKKQRAVDYFFSQLTVVPIIEKYEMKGIFISLQNYHDILETAEAMEREQIKESYIAGFNYRDTFNWECDAPWDTKADLKHNEQEFEKYYNETYKVGEQ